MDFKTLVSNFFQKDVNSLAAVIIALAVAYFLFGVVKYMQTAGDPKGRAAALSAIFWGIIGIAFMVSLWGVVNIGLSFFTQSDKAPVIQQQFN
jgi:uncharacterized membrane protein YidH (DUF202 family)